MNPIKRLLKSDRARNGLAWLAARYIRMVNRTTRWTVIRPPASEKLQSGRRGFIMCFWHGRMIMMRAGVYPDVVVHMLISEHRDGMLISKVATRFDVRQVAGSSRRGGVAALRAMQRLLAEDQCVAVTPDGPRGPRMRAKPGAVKAAQLSGKPMIPVSGAVSHRRILRTWDRFYLALPFCRGVVLWGEPIHVPRRADDEELERLRALLEERLNALTAEADRHFGQPVMAPAARPATMEPVNQAPGSLSEY
jgi:lysophospholipid acyltransferase (LPLAT)-like uncharacterized protein